MANDHRKTTGAGSDSVRRSDEVDWEHGGENGSGGGVPKNKRPVLSPSSPRFLCKDIPFPTIPHKSAPQTGEAARRRKRKDKATRLPIATKAALLSIVR